MAKQTPSKLDNMPSNIIRPIPLPITSHRFFVIDKDTGDNLFFHDRAWYAYDNARQRHNRGENVDVVVWDETTGKHVPTIQVMTKVNKHGDIEGDWLAVANQRFADAKAKRTNNPAAPKESKAVVRDTATADMFKNLSMILNNASVNMRKGLITDEDIAALYKEVNDLGDHLYGMLPEQANEPQPVQD